MSNERVRVTVEWWSGPGFSGAEQVRDYNIEVILTDVAEPENEAAQFLAAGQAAKLRRGREAHGHGHPITRGID